MIRLKIVILSTLVCLLLLSCHHRKLLADKDISQECKAMFQDLMKHTVSVDSNYIDFVARDKTKTKKEAYIDFSQGMLFRLGDERLACISSFNKQDIIELFGQPNKTRSKPDNWFYVYNFGPECPCLDCNQVNYYNECNIIELNFDDMGYLETLFVDVNAMLWE